MEEGRKWDQTRTIRPARARNGCDQTLSVCDRPRVVLNVVSVHFGTDAPCCVGERDNIVFLRHLSTTHAVIVARGRFERFWAIPEVKRYKNNQSKTGVPEPESQVTARDTHDVLRTSGAAVTCLPCQSIPNSA